LNITPFKWYKIPTFQGGGRSLFFTKFLKQSNSDEVQEEVMTSFKVQAAELYDSGIPKLVPSLNKCLDNAGGYV
jgi:hypothetical protein